MSYHSGGRFRYPRAVIAVLALLLAGAEGRADNCPESCVFNYCSPRARADTTEYHECFGYSLGRAGYDLVAGTLAVRLDANDGCGPGLAPRCTARDRFVLIGPSSPVPVSFTVSLRLTGQTQRFFSRMGGSLAEGNNTPVSADTGTTLETPLPLDFNQTLSLQLSRAVGEPFEITYSAYESGCCFQDGYLNGSLVFPDLPPGYGVTSCQGYSAGAVVPTLRRTWGQVKARYH